MIFRFAWKKNFFFFLVFQSAANWKKVFYITSGVYLVGALAYGIFASGEKQPWAEPKENGVDDEKTKDEGLDNRALQLDKSGN